MIGAIEEILLRHRALVDDAIRPLQENTPIDAFLKDIEGRVLALQQQEPSFWELRVVEYIHYVVERELKSKLRIHPEGGGDKTLEAEVEAVEAQIKATTREQLQRLLDVLDNNEQSNNTLSRDGKATKERFLEVFWRSVVQFAEASNQLDAPGDEQLHEDYGDIDNDEVPGDATSYEAITFDDLQFETGSANSAPSTEELPMILEAFGDQRVEERKDALNRLSQERVIELVHCSSQFQPMIEGLLSLLLDEDMGIAGDSMRQLYSILNHVEEPTQFLTVYLSTIEMVGFCVTSGALAIETSELFSGSDDTTKAVNVFRLLLMMMNRAPHHWIHYPQEKLVRALCSTFIVLMLDPISTYKKPCRPLDVLAVLDTDAAWLHTWTAKIPSSVQLFVSIDECGLLSDIMYALTRVRPFEIEMEDFEKMKATNMLNILSALSRYRPGRDLLFSWTKLPAHMQQQRRFTAWRGLDKQFQLDTLATENDRLYHFHRTDREMHQATSMELEDCNPLEEQAQEGVVLSAVAMYLFESREARWLESTALSACSVVRFLSAREDFLTPLLELMIACSETTAMKSTAKPITSTEEREETDPWFPFRRPRSAEAVAKLVMDSTLKRIARGRLNVDVVRSRCIRVLDALLGCAGHLDALSASLVRALAKATRVLLIASDTSATGEAQRTQLDQGFFENLQRILATAPYTLPTLLFESSTSILSQLTKQLNRATDPATRDAVSQLILSLAQHSSVIHDLCVSDAWRVCIQYSLHKWRTNGPFDDSILPLLSRPVTARAFFHSQEVLAQLHEMQRICELDLDVPLALNAPPQEAPYRLRRFSELLAWLRAAFASQHASLLFTDPDSGNKWVALVVEAITRHKNGVCCASSQSEDRCTMVFEMLSALTGCVPSMIGLYDLLLRNGLQSLEPADNTSISACSLLVESISSSLDHVGASLHEWIHPKPLFAFDAHSESLSRVHSPTARQKTLTASMTGALEHMLASIAESNLQDTPLDLSMLSQATWELIGDIESVPVSSIGECSWDSNTLARAFGKLIFELARSGRSKLCEVVRDGSVVVEPAAVVSAPTCFPTDAERKLMNRYYKDYCSSLGLKASPTTLHVLTKIFGKAAVDCFPITMLMVLDQAYGEQDVIDVLQFCASCPSISVLWPRVTELPTKQHAAGDESSLPSLLPLAQAAEMVLETEFPQVSKTLKQCHCSVLALMLRWHSQCYWNFLPWDKLLIMMHLNFLYGAEFQVYLFVIALKHMEPTFRSIITSNGTDSARAFVEVLQAPIVGFQFSTSRDLVLRLRSSYHDRISQILLKCP